MTSNERQVGGSHYRASFQHWDWVSILDFPYLPAQVTKYITRWRKKNGLQDLEKAHHFLAKFIEEHEKRRKDFLLLTENFLNANDVEVEETKIIWRLVEYHTNSGGILQTALRDLEDLIMLNRSYVPSSAK